MTDPTKQLLLFDVPKDATSCLYIEGIPPDATEREVAHIFRPFPGYMLARLIPRSSKSGRKYFYCFVDFQTEMQATICMETVQGYRFHKNDSRGLKLSYAVPTNKVKRERSRRRSRSGSFDR